MIPPLNDAASIKRKLGNSAYGPAFGNAVDADCYLEPGNRRAVNANGQDTLCNLFGIFAASTDIAVGDEVAWSGQRYEVVDVQQLRPGGVVSHIEALMRSVGAAE